MRMGLRSVVAWNYGLNTVDCSQQHQEQAFERAASAKRQDPMVCCCYGPLQPLHVLQIQRLYLVLVG